jgi:hypothetical protein
MLNIGHTPNVMMMMKMNVCPGEGMYISTSFEAKIEEGEEE